MSAPRILAQLQDALAHHQAGRLAEAERLYKKVIKADPKNANALNLLGTIAFSRNRTAEAEVLYRRALAANPRMASGQFNLGNLLSITGDHAGALAAYDRALALEPQSADAHLNRGALLQKMDRPDEAIAALTRFIAMAPRDARGHYNLAQCLKAQSQFAQAEESYARVLSLQPQHRDAHLALAEIHTRNDHIAEALRHTRLAIAIQPTPESYSNLGDLLRRAKLLNEALAAHEQALAVRPDDPILLHNSGSALYDARRLEDARAAFEKALAADPAFIRGYEGLAKIYEHREDFRTAIELLERALRLDPAADKVIFKLSYCYFAVGDFPAGWRNYEKRFEGTESYQHRRPTPPPYWKGEDLTGKSILIWTEQGIGDQILYSSMIPDVIARAGRCIIECKDRLTPIFTRSFPEATVATYRSQAEAATPPDGLDFQSPVGSLGGHLRPSLESFPRRSRYMTADPARASVLRERYSSIAPGNLIVGLSWRSKNAEIGEIKSADLVLWRDILVMPGVTFVNLQYGDCATELAEVEAAFGTVVVQDSGIDPLTDMDAFFAQVAAMDLVISTSNTTVHVAGALGVPTWLILLGSPADVWYWFRGRSDSPWYVSLRIFRKAVGQDDCDNETHWRRAFTGIAQDLKRLTAVGADHHAVIASLAWK